MAKIFSSYLFFVSTVISILNKKRHFEKIHKANLENKYKAKAYFANNKNPLMEQSMCILKPNLLIKTNRYGSISGGSECFQKISLNFAIFSQNGN